MNEALTLTLVLAWLIGGVLGAIFFGSLWWTIRKGISSKQPALWFLPSLLLRMGIALAGFYFVSDGDWKRLLVCLLGFVMVRMVVTWLTHSSGESQTGLEREASHAP